MKGILRSLGILCTISASVGLFLSEFNISFWISFAFITAVQIASWNVFRYYQQSKTIARNQELDKLALEQISKQSALLPCAVCNAEQIVSVELKTANTFECEACNQKNSVYINIETAAMTVLQDQ